jgi:hypothetical protein
MTLTIVSLSPASPLDLSPISFYSPMIGKQLSFKANMRGLGDGKVPAYASRS